jgi:hypothetical protein
VFQFLQTQSQAQIKTHGIQETRYKKKKILNEKGTEQSCERSQIHKKAIKRKPERFKFVQQSSLT